MDQWHAQDLIGAIVAIAAIATIWFRYYPIKTQRRARKILEREFGSEHFGRDVIERSTKYYVPPECSSVDPTGEAEIRHVVTARQKLYEVVDAFLKESTERRHLLLLADSGMGKTSFVLNYYARNQQRSRKDRPRIAVVPLGIPDADGYIASLEKPQDTILFLDAFDEDTKAIEDHKARVHELMQSVRQFKRIVLTSRTQFFPSDEETPVETGIARVGPRKAGEKAVWEFWKLYLMPLGDQDIKKFIAKRYPVYQAKSRKKARSLVRKVPLLSVRPMLLAAMPDLLESEVDFNTQSDIYHQMIERWLERESSWVDMEALRDFSRKLALDLFRNRSKRGSERIPGEVLVLHAAEWNIPLENWQITGRSLLNRDAAGNYKFAHRSIMEYLVALEMYECNTGRIDLPVLTDQIRLFFIELNGERNLFSPLSVDILAGPSDGKYNFEKVILTDLWRLTPPLERFGPSSAVRRWGERQEQHSGLVARDHSSSLTWLVPERTRPVSVGAADEFVHLCNSKQVGGFEDWRLPTLNELGYAAIQEESPISEALELNLSSFWVDLASTFPIAKLSSRLRMKFYSTLREIWSQEKSFFSSSEAPEELATRTEVFEDSGSKGNRFAEILEYFQGMFNFSVQLQIVRGQLRLMIRIGSEVKRRHSVRLNHLVRFLYEEDYAMYISDIESPEVIQNGHALTLWLDDNEAVLVPELKARILPVRGEFDPVYGARLRGGN